MFRRIFPSQFDNDYRGYRLAVWLLVPIVLVKLIMSVNIFVNTRDIIRGPDAIPLDAFSAVAAAVIVQCFRSWTIANFVLAALGLLAVVRYRAMVPLMYLALAVDNVARVALFLAGRFARGQAGEPSLGLNIVLAAALLIGFALSLGKTDKTEGA